ncbi:vWA domain-containing protein [Mycobacterium sp. 852002-51057_SCH5723018]|uniref:vWA domain-containing protein n=1 Tax=Mycobacterium sp. 852002-51057_SCH5723018 TaxID=1834094 RepID=UPI0008013173|nr:vWA domain-containing protein [Mycobacterium sp. 852002-51057_SCH5723018]OBG29130.1 hypothetical protein A5764_23365 [Mycobacterium sp. 852002-51057_SCH5723018]
MTFEPVLPWAILAVVAGALALARLVALWRVLLSNTAGRTRGRAVLRWSGVTLAVFLIIAATTRPALRGNENRYDATPAIGENLNVFVVVDRSADSGVEDYGAGEPRIAGIRDDIAALIKQYPAARFAVIGFASRASLNWPLSGDVWSLRPTIAALSSQSAGSDVDANAAGNLLRYQLIEAAQQYPGSRNVVVYFGSGAPGSRAPQGDFDLMRGSVAGGAVLGYGRSDAIDEAELRRIAGQLGVHYLHRDPSQPLRLELPHGTGTGADTGERSELYWLPALLAAGLLLSEIYLSVREFRRGRIARRDLTS